MATLASGALAPSLQASRALLSQLIKPCPSLPLLDTPLGAERRVSLSPGASRIVKAGSQKKIKLASLLRLNPEAVDYTGLKAAVARAAAM